ncbi:MAG: S-adenosylmethionine:tRNA ribosyltransferase-isomerase [Candidatus Omnitrophota bacterium]|jgi:S-adenosylmethionine:tRNA ribosyltransferase-isomerase
MLLSDFKYNLPDELIAQEPLKRRDEARLLVVNRQDETIKHDSFSNLGKYLPKQSHIVLNNSKVIPARLLGNRRGSGGGIELFLVKQVNDGYEVLLRPLKRL